MTAAVTMTNLVAGHRSSDNVTNLVAFSVHVDSASRLCRFVHNRRH